MKKQFLIIGVAVLFVSVVLSGCEERGIVVGAGEVQYIDLEGGFYGIIGDDGKYYDPINLPTKFQEDELKVSYVLKILENQTSIHVWGTVVKILEIEQDKTNPSGKLVNHSDCKEADSDQSSSMDCVEYQYDGESELLLKHVNAGFNCCPEITANIGFSNSTITIDEIEISGLCDCLCLFDLYYEIQNITPGKYTIQISEPYVGPDDEKLTFSVNLTSETTGSYCVERYRYPWGQG